MKVALCVKSIEEIVELHKGKKETIDTYLVSRSICEKPENNFLQIIPYVSFYYFDKINGKLNVVQYLRAAKGNEDRLYSKTSIGFGGHIDNMADISYSEHFTMEDGSEHFIMNKDQLFETIFNTAKRELEEELGVNVIDELSLKINADKTAFFTGDMNEEVNKVHIGFSIPIKLSEKKHDKFYEIIKANKDEIDTIGSMKVSIKDIVEDMNLDVTLQKIANELKIKNNMEDWSLRVLDFIIRIVLNDLLKHVTYEDIIKISEKKKHKK